MNIVLNNLLSVFQRHAIAIWPLAIAAFVFALLVFNPWLKPWLRYDEGAVLQGEWWRLVSAHFVHLGWMHGFLNMVGFALIALLYPAGRWINWLLFYVVSSVLISSYIVLDSGTYYYVGASGVLHGLFILGAYFSQALSLWRRYMLVFIVIGKLFWEQSSYYVDTGVGDAIGGFVYVDAHLIGGLCGLFLVIIFLIKNRLKFPIYD